MLPPTSIFRKMPVALALSLRRLMGALAYSYDMAELSYWRLQVAAAAYRMPGELPAAKRGDWSPQRRLGLLTDAWACIDAISRMGKVVRRFPFGDPEPPEVATFISNTKPARDIRNRLQHLDEDVFDGKNVSDGNPILGCLNWVDGRDQEAFYLFSVISGPAIDGGKMISHQFEAGYEMGSISKFTLMAADQTVSIDEQIRSARIFMVEFEQTVARNIRSILEAGIAERGATWEQAAVNWPCDTVSAMRFTQNGEHWLWDPDGSAARTEVPPGWIVRTVADLST